MPKPASGSGYHVWVVVDRTNRKLTPTHTWVHLDSAGVASVLQGRDTASSGAGVVGDLRHLN